MVAGAMSAPAGRAAAGACRDDRRALRAGAARLAPLAGDPVRRVRPPRDPRELALQRLNLARYPYLPGARVAMTAATAYLGLLSGGGHE